MYFAQIKSIEIKIIKWKKYIIVIISNNKFFFVKIRMKFHKHKIRTIEIMNHIKRSLSSSSIMILLFAYRYYILRLLNSCVSKNGARKSASHLV